MTRTWTGSPDYEAVLALSQLKDILDQLVADCGEEYLKLHMDKQGFRHTNNRMDYYENKAIEHITMLFPATKTIRLPAVNHRNSEYNRGYNSGYIAAKRKATDG